jgi:hypothetical protein
VSFHPLIVLSVRLLPSGVIFRFAVGRNADTVIIFDIWMTSIKLSELGTNIQLTQSAYRHTDDLLPQYISLIH